MAFKKLKAQHGKDDDLARDGAWCTLDSDAGIRWRIASAGTDDAERARHAIQLRAIESARGNDFDVGRDGDVEWLASLVRGWEGMMDDDGQLATVTPDTIRAALEAFPEWRGRALGFAQNPKNYRKPGARALARAEGD